VCWAAASENATNSKFILELLQMHLSSF
jgi:hypothetical protein